MDQTIVEVFGAVAESLGDLGLAGSDLRERKHLAPVAKAEMERRLDVPVGSPRLRSAAFPRVGPVDLAVDEPDILIELKWSYGTPTKIFESVWDSLKLAILGAEHGHSNLYIATGASREDWERSECSDLFESGTIDALEIWSRRLASGRGPNNGRTVCEDLILGATGAQPAEGPHDLEVEFLESFEPSEDFELRLIAVNPAQELVDWPNLDLSSGNTIPGAASVDLVEDEINLLLGWVSPRLTEVGQLADPALVRLDDKLRNARPRG